MKYFICYKKDNLIYYQINVNNIFLTEYLKKNKWTIIETNDSNDSHLKKIKSHLPGFYEYSDKAKLYYNLSGKSYMSSFINFSINYIYWYEKMIQKKIDFDDTIWYLKKSGDITYGGFDVFPIKASKETFKSDLNFCIKESNYSRKYYSPNFTLQKGIEDICLTKDGKKFDLRTYGLIVWNNNNVKFYYYNDILMRKNPNKYDKNSINKSIQLTNTTYNRERADIREITELLIKKDEYWKKYFYKSKMIYIDICKNIKTNKNIYFDEIGYQLIGLDFIPNIYGDLFLLEINKSPAIYYDEKIDLLHKGMERTMFNEENFFKLTFEAFEKNKLVEKNTSHFHYCEI